MPAGWVLGVLGAFRTSEHDSPLAVVEQDDSAKGFSRLTGITVLGVGEVPATLSERLAGLFQPF